MAAEPQPGGRPAARFAAPAGGWRWTVALAAFALAVRLLVLAVTLAWVSGGAVSGGAVSGGAAPGSAAAGAAAVARLHDGREYQQVAASLRSAVASAVGGDGEAARPGDARPPAEARRLAPGYPLLIALAALLLPLPQAALAVSLLAAALAAALLHRLRVAPAAVALWAVLTPSSIAFSATAMSEAPFVALALAGLLAWRRGEPPATPERGSAVSALRTDVLAGLAFGAATLVRPVGVVLFAALALVRPGRRRGRRLLAAVAGFALPPAAWLVTGWWLQLGPPAQLTVYLRRDAALPLSSLAAGLVHPLADPLKWLQVIAVLALVAAAGGCLWHWREAISGHRDWTAWLASQTVFYLLLPSSWVFECLPRFLVPALPAVAAALEPALPPPGRRRRVRVALLLAGLTAACGGISVWWNLRALGVL